jgi:hypothetical protein
MSTITKETEASQNFEQLKTRLKTTWMTGDYDVFSRFMEKDATQFFGRLGIKRSPGTSLPPACPRPFCGEMKPLFGSVSVKE